MPTFTDAPTIPQAALAGRVAEADANGKITWVPSDQVPATRAPRHHGLAGWSVHPHLAAGAASPSGGRLYVARVYVEEAVTLSTLWYSTSLAGSGATALANCFLGVYSSAGTLLGQTANQATAMAAAPANKSAALTVQSGQSLALPGGQDQYVWAGFVIGTQSTTAVQLQRGAANSAYLGNLGIADGAGLMFGVTATTGLTALPTTFTPSGLVSTSAYVIGLA